MIELRDYQEEIKERVYAAWEAGCRSVMCQMPTGTGKTVVMSQIVSHNLRSEKLKVKSEKWAGATGSEEGKTLSAAQGGTSPSMGREASAMRVLVVAHRKEILEQIKETLGKYGLDDRLADGSIVVESIQKLSKGLMTEGQTLALGANAQDMTDGEASGIVADDSTAQLLSTGVKIDNSTAQLLSTGGVGDDSAAQLLSTGAVTKDSTAQLLSTNADITPSLVIIDEAHHCTAKTYRMLWEAFPEARFLGMTATPCRLKKEGFTELFDRLICSEPIAKFIHDGWLANYEFISIRTDSETRQMIQGLKKRAVDGDYQTKEMEEVLGTRASIEQLYRSYKEYADGKKGIIYAINREHARHIAEYYTLALGANAQDMPDGEPSGIMADDSTAQLSSTGGVGDNSAAQLLSTEGVTKDSAAQLPSTGGVDDDSAAQLPSTKAVGDDSTAELLRTEGVGDDSIAQLPSAGSVGDDSAAKLSSTGADDSAAQLPSTKAVAVVDSGTPKKERERINKEYREGKIRILVNCEIYGEGLDVKDVEMIQLARPTLSLNKYLQQVGRGLRPNKDGAQTIILDNVGMYYRFGLPHDDRDWERMFLYGQTDDTQEMQQRVSEQGNRERMQVNHSKSDVTDGHHHEMMTITNASEVQEALDLKYSKTEVFEYKGELGLRRGKTIVLIPMHKKIGPFVGGYAMVDGTFFVSEFGDTYTNFFRKPCELIEGGFVHIIGYDYYDLIYANPYNEQPEEVIMFEGFIPLVRIGNLYYLRRHSKKIAFRKEDLWIKGNGFQRKNALNPNQSIYMNRMTGDKVFVFVGYYPDGVKKVRDYEGGIYYRVEKGGVPVWDGQPGVPIDDVEYRI